MSLTLHIGNQHDRPDTLTLNLILRNAGSDWRVTTAKSIGLHIYNLKTQECKCPDDNGDAVIPDLPDEGCAVTALLERESKGGASHE